MKIICLGSGANGVMGTDRTKPSGPGERGAGTKRTRLLLGTLCTGLVVAAFGLAGCANEKILRPAESATTVPVSVRIAQSSEQIERLLSEMVMIERSRTGAGDFKPPSEVLPADDPLQKRSTLIWTGDARIVVKRIADMAGLELTISGKSPTTLMVSLDAQDRPLANILESVGVQLGANADLVYKRADGLIELRYR